MEKVTRVKSQDLGLAMLQARKHAGKSQRDHRMWKGLSLKGLGEIEEIDKEEVSIKMMHALERFMRAYPAVWSESAVQYLLVEIADTRYASLQNSEAEERLQTIINRILVPMAKIMEAEQGFMMVERQKIQEATLALQRSEEECHHALEDLTQERDRSAKRIEELEKALEENKISAKEAGSKLAAKEKQIHDMLEKQRNLVIRLVCGGPTGFVEWAREEMQSHGLTDLDNDIAHAWRLATAVTDQVIDKMLISDQLASNSPANPSLEDEAIRSNPRQPGSAINCCDSSKPMLPTSWTNLSMKLLGLVICEVFHQMEESYGRVKSPLSLPSVIAGFWIGLARRFAYLAVATVLPHLVMEKTTTSPGCSC